MGGYSPVSPQNFESKENIGVFALATRTVVCGVSHHTGPKGSIESRKGRRQANQVEQLVREPENGLRNSGSKGGTIHASAHINKKPNCRESLGMAIEAMGRRCTMVFCDTNCLPGGSEAVYTALAALAVGAGIWTGLWATLVAMPDILAEARLPPDYAPIGPIEVDGNFFVVLSRNAGTRQASDIVSGGNFGDVFDQKDGWSGATR